jgi:hypothetical protein
VPIVKPMAAAGAASHALPRTLSDNAADTVRGIGLVALAYCVLSIGDVTAKWAMMSTGVAWVLLWRGLFGAAAVVAVTGARPQTDGLARLRPVRWKLLFVRAALSSFTTTAW